MYTDQSYVVSTESDVAAQPVSSDSVPISPVPLSPPPFVQDQEVPQDQGVLQDHPAASGDPDEHRRAFETGRIDYTGRDSFQRIQEHLDSRLNEN